MSKVTQPNILPTNKLGAATITAITVELIGVLLRNFAPDWYDPNLMAAATPLVAFAVAWFVKDEMNI